MRIYLSNSLTQAPKEFVKEMEALKCALREKHEVLDWFGLGEGSPREIYEHDVDMVKSCDLLLAECSHPAIGLGFELAMSVCLNKPVLAVAKEGASVSRLVMGVTHPLFTFKRYQKTEEILHAIEQKILDTPSNLE